MNIKKLFSVAAVVTFLGSTFLPGLALAATPDTELGKAYEWAYANGITTKDTYEAANMTAPITRAEMAKMLSNYAKKFKNMTPDTSATCNFGDTASVGGDLAVAIIESCQLGIMGQGISNFRPYDTITRAEFGTALSRVLWDKTYEGGTPYYAGHLNALKTAGIMTVIANAESMKEVRGYVMLMLMRAEDETPSICEETDVKVICAVEEAAEEYKDCPAACRKDNTKEEEKDSDEVVKAGDLDVTTSGDSNGRLFIGRASDLDTITLKTSEEVTISKIVLEREGYSVRENIKSVWLEDENGAKIAEGKTPDSKGQVKLTLKKDYKVVDGELNAIVVVETYSACDVDHTSSADCTNANDVAWAKLLAAGGTIGFKVVDVESTAKNTNISGKANTYSAIAYDGSKISFTFKANADKDYNWSAGETYEVAKFKVNAPEDSSIIVRGFTFKQSPVGGKTSLDLRKYFDSAEVTIAGEKVSGLNASVNKDDELVISFKDVEIASKQKAEVIIKIALVEDFDQFGNIVKLIMKDYVAVDGKVESRVSNQTAYTALTTYAFRWGKIKLTNTKLGNVDAALESDDIVVAEGNITIPEAVKGTFTIRATWKWVWAIKELTVSINGEETDATKWTCDLQDANDDYCDFVFSNVEIEKSGKVKFLMDTVNSTNNTLKYNTQVINFNAFNVERFADTDDAIKYDESGKSARGEISGSISFSKVTIQPAKASMTNSMTKEVEFNNAETNTKVVFEGTYTAKKGDVYLNEFLITSNDDVTDLLSSTNYKNIVTFYVYIDNMDDVVGDHKLTCTAGVCTASDTFNNILVKAGESVKVKVEAEVEANNKLTANDTKFAGNNWTSIDLGKYQVKIQWEDVNGNSNSWVGQANTVALKVVIKGSVSISAGATKETVLYKAADAEIAAFTVKPANGASETDLEEIKFLLKNGNNPIVPDTSNLVDGYATVKANGTTADCSKWSTAGEIICSFNEKVGSEGINVTVSLDNDVTGVVKLTGLNINGKPQTREFKKRFESAVVSIKSMKDLGGTTQFTLGVEKDSDLTVRNLTLTFDVDEDWKTTWTKTVDLKKVFDDEDTIEAKGMKDGVRLVTAISYYATYDANDNACEASARANIDDAWAVTPATDGAYCLIEITKEGGADNYADFFKVGDQYARTYKSN